MESADEKFITWKFLTRASKPLHGQDCVQSARTHKARFQFFHSAVEKDPDGFEEFIQHLRKREDRRSTNKAVEECGGSMGRQCTGHAERCVIRAVQTTAVSL
ncbi:unnamed protein product [Durusdinium trenchii]|uniref:Uncharacterized protein n=1 Tax=Durusdinium trenchii TaxID=1381693 RepID=A0ABP0HLA0_9DINO